MQRPQDRIPLKPRKTFFRAISQLLKLQFTAMVTFSFQTIYLFGNVKLLGPTRPELNPVSVAGRNLEYYPGECMLDKNRCIFAAIVGKVASSSTFRPFHNGCGNEKMRQMSVAEDITLDSFSLLLVLQQNCETS